MNNLGLKTEVVPSVKPFHPLEAVPHDTWQRYIGTRLPAETGFLWHDPSPLQERSSQP